MFTCALKEHDHFQKPQLKAKAYGQNECVSMQAMVAHERPSSNTARDVPMAAPAEYGCHKKRAGNALDMAGAVQQTMNLVTNQHEFER